MPGQVAATTVATAVEALAHKYIAGENVKQVLKTIERLLGQDDLHPRSARRSGDYGS